MRKVKVTLHGTITYSAQRTFELEVAEDAPLQLMAPHTLSDLADSDKIPWNFEESGYLEPTDFTVEDIQSTSAR